MGQRIEKVKQHFCDNKKAYFACGLTAATTYYLTRSGDQVRVDTHNIKINSPTNNVVEVQMVRPGPKSYVVQCRETQATYPSLRAAARAADINPGELSKHLKGDVPSVNGLHYDKLTEV